VNGQLDNALAICNDLAGSWMRKKVLNVSVQLSMYLSVGNDSNVEVVVPDRSLDGEDKRFVCWILVLPDGYLIGIRRAWWRATIRLWRSRMANAKGIYGNAQADTLGKAMNSDRSAETAFSAKCIEPCHLVMPNEKSTP
jgi:hypothetical protein